MNNDDRTLSSIRVEKATNRQTEKIAEMLTDAFDQDPVVNWFVRQDNKRRKSFELMFATFIERFAMPEGMVYATDDLSGAAVWMPPVRKQNAFFPFVASIPSFIFMSGVSRLPKNALAYGLLEASRPKKPHYYLQFIGRASSAKKRGLGTALIRPVLELCDREKTLAYLENSNEKNLGFYAANGFGVCKVVKLPLGGPNVWLMERKPR